jgi:pSer/pThr/pTyr-binding forkhead associated (FHA) protein
VIRCPACKHEEYDGTLFCSECGTQLWEGEAAQPDDAQDTQRFGVDELTRAPDGQVEPALTEMPGALATPRQLVVRIQGSVEPIFLLGRSEYRLGRSDPRQGIRPDLDLGPYRALELGVSRLHAVLTCAGSTVTVTDLGSTNGTLVNGTRLEPNTPLVLRDGDELRLGKLTLRLYLKTG